MKTRRAWACLAAVAAVSFGVGFVGAAGASNDQTFTDPSESIAAADVTSVRVRNDDAGMLSFAIQFSNRTALGNEGISLYVDSDANQGTGSAGSEYRLRYFGASVPQMKLEQWNGSTWDENAPQSSFSGTFDSATQTLTFAVSRTELGNTAGFNFFVFTAATGTSDQDYAPDMGRYTYQVVISSPSPPPPPPPPPPSPPAALPPPPDTDRDGVVDTRDGCPTLASGPYDRNANGCPGPYARMRPSFHPIASTSGGFTTYTQFVISNLVPGASVTVSFRGSVEHLRAKRRSVASKLLVRKPAHRGTPITLRAVKRGTIGYAATVVVTTVAPAYRIVRTLCIPATGSKAARSCSRVDRGK